MDSNQCDSGCCSALGLLRLLVCYLLLACGGQLHVLHELPPLGGPQGTVPKDDNISCWLGSLWRLVVKRVTFYLVMCFMELAGFWWQQWYGVPGKFASKFEAVIRGIVMDSFRDQPNLLYCMTTQMSPELLSNSGVPVYRMIQQPGEFILTFPKAFHAGFSYGFNIAEAVNFCTPDWLPFGREAIDAYRRVARPSVLSHERLVLTLAHNVRPDWSQEVMYNLLKDLERIVRDEEAARNRAQLDGLRFGIVPKSRLQKNNLVYVDVSGMDYDEKRTCHECKDICFISAVACECSQEKVSCLRHYATMCRCPLAKRFALIWHEMDELWGLVERVKNIAARRVSGRGGWVVNMLHRC